MPLFVCMHARMRTYYTQLFMIYHDTPYNVHKTCSAAPVLRPPSSINSSGHRFFHTPVNLRVNAFENIIHHAVLIVETFSTRPCTPAPLFGVAIIRSNLLAWQIIVVAGSPPKFDTIRFDSLPFHVRAHTSDYRISFATRTIIHVSRQLSV